ncbi:hypothetical protein CHS0354_017047 [Potamilus streckersoni]|uniref:BTB domain-containing protein n=1 Tax=Potamilus streckersoni TaxID=2493646 RepID=A0AAE0SZS9_9BIVA|nr:hypothetical protein CHS0354_017047 [Potamilus streckersoni]
MASNCDKQSWARELLVKNVEPPELFKKSKATDITIMVGGKALHFAKFPLTQGSDVLAQMIENSADQSRLQLRDVAYNDMIMFLKCLHPKTFESITDKNLEPVTSVAHKFKHEAVPKRFE